MKTFLNTTNIQKLSASLLTFFFISTVVLCGINNLGPLSTLLKFKNGHIEISLKGINLEKQLNKTFFKKFFFININGFQRKFFGQREMNNLIRNCDDELFMLQSKQPTQNTVKVIQRKSKSIETIYKYSSKISFLFVQVPTKVIKNRTSLPVSKVDYGNEIYDLWGKILKEKQIPYLDLRETIGGNIEFYKTDHHWRVETAFYATKSIIETLDAIYNLALNNDDFIGNIQNYKLIKREKAFLGSYGIRVGEYFAGKDDIVIPVPKYETDFIYRHFISHKLVKEKKGKFENAFIDFDILNNSSYYNKYNACLHGGYAENRIINLKSKNNLKLLFISHSYGRPLAQYISLHFAETRYLDPRKGRHHESYIEYIKQYKPDVIIIMYNDDIPL